MSAAPKVAVIATGNELLTGTTLDTHSRTLSQWALLNGLDMRFHLSVGDDRPQLLWAFEQAAQNAGLIFVAGGLGPTVDDLTQPVLAEFAGVRLQRHQQTIELLQAAYQARGMVLHENNLKQADFPEGSDILSNPIGTAPGFTLVVNNTRFVCMPGVPREFYLMLEQQVTPRLSQWFPSITPNLRLVLRTYGATESGLDRRVKAIPDFPPEVTVGFRTQYPENDLVLTAAPDAREALYKARELAYFHLSPLIYSEGASIAETLINLLKDRGLRLCVVESCTGGQLGALITSAAGASNVFDGGVLTYSNEAKEILAGVAPSIIETYGAVSEPCARAMAEGFRNRWRQVTSSQQDVAVLSITGIAGPGGGAPDKPVGTVWIACAGPWETLTRGFTFRGDRDQNRTLSVRSALELLRRQVLGLPLDISKKGYEG